MVIDMKKDATPARDDTSGTSTGQDKSLFRLLSVKPIQIHGILRRVPFWISLSEEFNFPSQKEQL
jgi:hypothetical protein